MKMIVKKILGRVKGRILDLVRVPGLLAARLLATILAYIPGNPAHDIFYLHGFHLLRKHYYVPIPDDADVANGFWDKQSDLVGLDMNDKGALDLLDNVFPRYMVEFRARFPLKCAGDPRRFYLINGNYMAIDAHIYYAMIRHFKPRRIIEIGAGNSTLLSSTACLENQQETGQAVDLVAIEPFPSRILREGIPGVSRLIISKVQNVDLTLFTSLEANDILFIDSSHNLRTGNDVQFEYLEVLPRLAPNVLVHVHDISLPRAYPRVYYENHLYWNEQYLLQAFLAFSYHFQVLWPGNYMMLKYPEHVCAIFPEYHIMRQHYPMSEPSAFWMRSRA